MLVTVAEIGKVGLIRGEFWIRAEVRIFRVEVRIRAAVSLRAEARPGKPSGVLSANRVENGRWPDRTDGPRSAAPTGFC